MLSRFENEFSQFTEFLHVSEQNIMIQGQVTVHKKPVYEPKWIRNVDVSGISGQMTLPFVAPKVFSCQVNFFVDLAGVVIVFTVVFVDI